MHSKKLIGSLLIMSFLLSGCTASEPSNVNVSVGGDIAVVTSASTETSASSETTTEAAQEPFEFNNNLYIPKLADDVPQEYWDALNNLGNALRAGEDTFECASEEAYKWCTDLSVLASLLPASCMRITTEIPDGSKSYENGIGRISYKMPKDEYVKRQAEFEQMILDVLNSTIEKDDDDYEKCLKLYVYMETNYTYEHEGRVDGTDNNGFLYYTFMNHKGQCIDFSAVYSYLLLQAGVQAFSVGCDEPLDHEWVYAVVNGKGYYIDPTWGLLSETGLDLVKLDYFMMSGDLRVQADCNIDNLTSGLLPKFWVNNSKVKLDADDSSYNTGKDTFFKSLDEKNKTVYYFDEDSVEQQKKYA